MSTHTAATLKSFSSPPDLAVEEVPRPEMNSDEIRLRMIAAPVNPADLNVLEGKYGELPKLPAVVGNEGVGVVIEAGRRTHRFVEGDLALPMRRGTWAEEMVVPAVSAVRLPREIDAEQAAMLMVNPATALLLLRSFRNLREGEWILQNAANSGVGRCVIQLARNAGIRTLNVVRRKELIPALKELGADHVILEEDDLAKAVTSMCADSRPRLAFNSVGGSSALNLAASLGHGGTLVTFGAMGKQPLKIPNSFLIFRDLRFCGFWLTRWLRDASQKEIDSLYQALAGLVSTGTLRQPIAQKFPLSKLPEALEFAAKERRDGKVLLDLHGNSGS